MTTETKFSPTTLHALPAADGRLLQDLASLTYFAEGADVGGYVPAEIAARGTTEYLLDARAALAKVLVALDRGGKQYRKVFAAIEFWSHSSAELSFALAAVSLDRALAKEPR